MNAPKETIQKRDQRCCCFSDRGLSLQFGNLRQILSNSTIRISNLMVGAIGRLRTPATNRLIIQGRTQALASPHRWLGRQLGREPDRGLQRAIRAPDSNWLAQGKLGIGNTYSKVSRARSQVKA